MSGPLTPSPSRSRIKLGFRLGSWWVGKKLRTKCLLLFLQGFEMTYKSFIRENRFSLETVTTHQKMLVFGSERTYLGAMSMFYLLNFNNAD